MKKLPFLILLFALPLQAATYYLDAVNGNDSNNGSSIEEAWETIERAYEEDEGDPNVDVGDTVYLMTGDYGNFFFNGLEHAGWITYEAYTGETPVFSKTDAFDALRVYGNVSVPKTAYLIFKGITVYHAGALVRYVSKVKFYDCIFTGPGYSMETPYVVGDLNLNYAIQLHTSTEVVIDGCTITGDGSAFDSYVGYDDSVRVEATNGSPIITGTNTTWTSAQEGKLFSCVTDVNYTVLSVQSNTQLTLTENYNETSGSGKHWGTSGSYEGTVGGIQGDEGGYGIGYGRGIWFLAPCQDVIINDCNIGGCDTAISTAGNSGITISNNNIHHITFDAITITGANPTGYGFSDPVIVEYNHIHDGIDMYLGRMLSSGAPKLNDFAHNDFIQGMAAAGVGYELNNFIVRGNHIHHSDGDAMFLRGAYLGGLYNTDWLIENNLVYDMGLRHIDVNALPMVVLHNVDGCVFRNNTLLVGKLLTKKDSGAGKPVRFSEFTGNIIAICALAMLQSGEQYTEIDLEKHNLINEVLYGSHLIEWDANSTLYNEYLATPMTTESFTSLFVDHANDDYNLPADSDAVGYSHVDYAPLVDILLVDRDGSPDAGCYEYTGLYVESGPPEPNPATWVTVPEPNGDNTISMVATTATSGPAPLSYSFRETTGNPGATSSGWQVSDATYTDTGLDGNTTYTYQCQIRDTDACTGTWSDSNSATATDTTAPTPNPATFATAPTALSSSSITMTATTGSDAGPTIEYYFNETTGNTGGDDSGWQSSPIYTDSGLVSNTVYTYTVQMRDSVPNTGTASSGSSATTKEISGLRSRWLDGYRKIYRSRYKY